MQPVYLSEDGVVRFHKNAIVRYLLDNGGFDLNDLFRKDFCKEDEMQFAQLIGLSLSGFEELSYTTEEASRTAWAMYKKEVDELQARNIVLEEMVAEARRITKEMVSVLFKNHPDDLEE